MCAVASGRLQHRTFGYFTMRHVSPERDQQLAGESDNSDPSHPTTFRADTLLEPEGQRTGRLVSPPPPGPSSAHISTCFGRKNFARCEAELGLVPRAPRA